MQESDGGARLTLIGWLVGRDPGSGFLRHFSERWPAEKPFSGELCNVTIGEGRGEACHANNRAL